MNVPSADKPVAEGILRVIVFRALWPVVRALPRVGAGALMIANQRVR